MRYTVLLLLIFSFVTSLNAQEFKLGKISKEHFDIPLSKEEKAAPAVFLNKYRRTNFEYRDDLDGWLLYTTVHEVIKINSISGFSYGTKKIQLFNEGRESEAVKKVEAYTYNIEGGEVVKIKTPKERIIKNRINENLDEVTITMPEVKQGTIIEYKYTVESSYYEIDDVIFQEDIPVKNAFAIIESPQFFDYNKFIKGYRDIISNDYVKLRQENASFELRNPFGGRTSKTLTNRIKYNDIVSEYHLQDIPALKEEPFVNNMENYRISVVYELATVEFKKGIKEKRAKSWDEVAEYLNNPARVAGQIDRASFLEGVSDTLKRKSVATLDRMNFAYNYIQDRMTWDRGINKYRSQDLKKAYYQKKGTAYEINTLLVSLLKRMGLKAAPVMASTKDNGIPIFPTVDGFDYAIAAVYYDNKWILMDASGKNLYPGLLPERVMNWEGRLLKENGESLSIPLFSSEHSDNKSSIIVSINKKGEISGKCRQKYSNNEGLSIRNILKGEDQDYQEDVLKEIINENNVYDVVFELENSSKPTMISYGFKTSNYTEIVDDKMYLSPHLFLEKPENPFKASNRELPIDFIYPRIVENTITFKLPKEYTVDSMPESIELKLSGGLGSYKIAFKQVNDQSIQVLSSFKSNSTLVKADAYNEIKNFYAQIVAKEKEKVVLKKK
ncbi:hypothetical protein GCM10011344_29470 [Dokdonia pacifica]|uniref:Transglutaminase-like superfamily protein n=1 Tax=Dokdonia pacifica TaxID=1627892 RepID=A0A239C3R7_9FLAO|nr:DUF3857 domain-containing protein [Dokdonia pacifica]GGG26791.1 hypothetical protein GCM10011344_29470 [Dokdonia pacifica]SNS14559.1 Transglutaminase-like superfamily protein [Dokdonia pacifica]